MSTVIKSTYQIQRINALKNQLQSVMQVNHESMVHRPNSKSWSPIEIAKHMVLGHEAYREKIQATLALKVDQGSAESEFTASAIPSFLIKRFPPVNGKVKFKMKTSKVFKPVLDIENLSEEAASEILQQLSDSLDELKNWIETYRSSPISLKKFNSAIGAVVRFNVPEACEFILCHNERHFFQLKNALSS